MMKTGWEIRGKYKIPGYSETDSPGGEDCRRAHRRAAEVAVKGPSYGVLVIPVHNRKKRHEETTLRGMFISSKTAYRRGEIIISHSP